MVRSYLDGFVSCSTNGLAGILDGDGDRAVLSRPDLPGQDVPRGLDEESDGVRSTSGVACWVRLTSVG